MDNQRRHILCALAAAPLGLLAFRATAQGMLDRSAPLTNLLASDLLTSNLKTPLAGAAPAVNLVADLPHKPDYTLNSWFAIGHFESRGHMLNYLVHLFALSIKGITVAVDSTASITDETTGLYEVQHNFYTAFCATASTDQLLVKTPSSEISGSLDSMGVRAQLKNASMRCTDFIGTRKFQKNK